MASASATVLASGFSHSTCLPAASAAIAISAWVSPGVAMSTRSMSSRSIRSCHRVEEEAQPRRVAAAATPSASRPVMRRMSTSRGRSKNFPTERNAWEWARPMNA